MLKWVAQPLCPQANSPDLAGGRRPPRLAAPIFLLPLRRRSSRPASRLPDALAVMGVPLHARVSELCVCMCDVRVRVCDV